MRIRTLGLIIAGLFVLATSACGASRQSQICGDINPPPSAQGDVAALEAAGNAGWEQRSDRAALQKAIDAWETLVKVDPSRHDIRVKLSRAHYFMADGHLWFDKEIDESATAGPEMAKHYQAGQFQAEFALGQKYPGYRTKYCARQPFEAALQQLDKGAAPMIYWYAVNLGRYALMSSLVEVLNQKDRIKGMMDTMMRFAPEFWHGGADRYFGAYYTKIPFPGGDLPKSAQYFEKSLERAPNYLATKVVYARMNLAKAGDRDKFKQLLDEVVAADTSQWPEVKPENDAEQRKAKYYLEEIDFLVEE